MKLFRKCAMTASMLCMATAAQAQYYPYAAPATLPAPTESRQMAYQNWSNYYEKTPESVQSPAPIPAKDSQVISEGHNNYDSALAGNGWSDGNGNHGAGNDGGCGNGGCDNGCDGGFICGGGYGLLNPCGTRWYGAAAYLHMTRNRPNPYQVSFDTTNPIGQLILNTDTTGDWSNGWEVTVGRYLGCNSAVEFTYWGLEGFSGSAFATDPAGPAGLNTPIDFRSLAFDDGVNPPVPVNAYYDGAQAHHLSRSNDINSLEINYVNYPMLGNNCSHVQMNVFAGVRYFQFKESTSFDTSFGDPEFGVDVDNEAYYSISTTNNLFVLQIGSRISYCFGNRLSVFATPRLGVYWNNMEQSQYIGRGDDVAALDISSNRDICSLMGQIDLGVNYQVTPRWAVYAGYRVVAISGIALADSQVPYLQDDLFGIADTDHNSNLVLHGAMAGVKFNF